jgi:hypothetical protein
MKITILKTHIANGAWAHAGAPADVSETRATELIRSGLAKPMADVAKAPEAPQQTSEVPEAHQQPSAAPADVETLEPKSAPVPSNKAAPTPKNK